MADKTCKISQTILIFTLALSFFTISIDVIAETGKKPDSNRIVKGKRLFEAYCQSCHGSQGIGEPVAPWSIRSPSFINAPALNDSQHAWHHTDENLIKIILEGSPNTKRMAGWKKVLSTDDARNLVDFMKSLWKPKALECQGPKHMSCM